jgi:hypothetical protein
LFGIPHTLGKLYGWVSFLRSNLGTVNERQSSRIQLTLFTPRDMENASSADNVDRATLAIFFDDQVKGLMGADLFS